MKIHEIELELNPGTLGGRFTTIEGLLTQVYEELTDRVFASGDSSVAEHRNAMATFLGRLKQVRYMQHYNRMTPLLIDCPSQLMTAEIPFTIELDDPLANSYIQNPHAPEDDPQMTIVIYDRTFEQNEELGLNDILVQSKYLVLLRKL